MGVRKIEWPVRARRKPAVTCCAPEGIRTPNLLIRRLGGVVHREVSWFVFAAQTVLDVRGRLAQNDAAAVNYCCQPVRWRSAWELHRRDSLTCLSSGHLG
jgi:hypothetical protein